MEDEENMTVSVNRMVRVLNSSRNCRDVLRKTKENEDVGGANNRRLKKGMVYSVDPKTQNSFDWKDMVRRGLAFTA